MHVRSRSDVYPAASRVATFAGTPGWRTNSSSYNVLHRSTLISRISGTESYLAASLRWRVAYASPNAGSQNRPIVPPVRAETWLFRYGNGSPPMLFAHSG